MCIFHEAKPHRLRISSPSRDPPLPSRPLAGHGPARVPTRWRRDRCMRRVAVAVLPCRLSKINLPRWYCTVLNPATNAAIRYCTVMCQHYQPPTCTSCHARMPRPPLRIFCFFATNPTIQLCTVQAVQRRMLASVACLLHGPGQMLPVQFCAFSMFLLSGAGWPLVRGST